MFSSLSQIQISGVIALLISTPFLIRTICNLYLANASKKWPKVSGTIIKPPEFGVKFGLLYRYTVNKYSYENDRIGFVNSNRPDHQRANEFEKKYALHQIIDVFYNPENPKQAVLQPGRTDGLLWAIIVLSIVFGVGCLAVFDQNLLMQLVGN